MKTLIAVYTTRAGQGSTFWGTSLAWTLSERRKVVLVDADMEAGTIANLFALRLDGQGIANCFGDRPARSEELEQQLVPVPGRPNLMVVPGLHGDSPGYEMSEALHKLGPALLGINTDVVIADLGHPLMHPNLRSARGAAEAICQVFHRAFIVIRAEHALLACSINVLRAARPPFGEIVVGFDPKDGHRKDVLATLGHELPDLPVREDYVWDAKRARELSVGGTPMTLGQIERALNLI